MQRVRVSVLHNTVTNSQTGESASASDADPTIVLPEAKANWLGEQVAIVEWVDDGADLDADDIPDALDESFDATEFVDQDYEIVVQAIERGAVDSHLAAVWDADLEERDGRVSVQEALRGRGYEPEDDSSEVVETTTEDIPESESTGASNSSSSPGG
jgi:hypothetical protein